MPPDQALRKIWPEQSPELLREKFTAGSCGRRRGLPECRDQPQQRAVERAVEAVERLRSQQSFEEGRRASKATWTRRVERPRRRWCGRIADPRGR